MHAHPDTIVILEPADLILWPRVQWPECGQEQGANADARLLFLGSHKNWPFRAIAKLLILACCGTELDARRNEGQDVKAHREQVEKTESEVHRVVFQHATQHRSEEIDRHDC